MAERADLYDGNHIAGDDFDRVLGLTVNVSSFATLRMVIRQHWADLLDPNSEDNGPDIVTIATLGAEISQVDDTHVRVQIPGSRLRVRAREYVYAVKGTTLLGARITVVFGRLPLGDSG